MRWHSFISDLVIVVATWAAVLWILRRRRPRVGADHQAVRSYRLHTSAAIVAMVGVTWFVAWLSTDYSGPLWLHTLLLPASLVFIAAGAILAAYAGWVGDP